MAPAGLSCTQILKSTLLTLWIIVGTILWDIYIVHDQRSQLLLCASIVRCRLSDPDTSLCHLFSPPDPRWRQPCIDLAQQSVEVREEASAMSELELFTQKQKHIMCTAVVIMKGIDEIAERCSTDRDCWHKTAWHACDELLDSPVLSAENVLSAAQ